MLLIQISVESYVMFDDYYCTCVTDYFFMLYSDISTAYFSFDLSYMSTYTCKQKLKSKQIGIVSQFKEFYICLFCLYHYLVHIKDKELTLSSNFLMIPYPINS